VRTIFRLLSGEFLRPVMLALLIGMPAGLGRDATGGWEHFAYRAVIGWWVFGLTAGIAVAVYPTYHRFTRWCMPPRPIRPIVCGPKLVREFAYIRQIAKCLYFFSSAVYWGAASFGQLLPLKVSDKPAVHRCLPTANLFFWLGDTGWELFHRVGSR